MNFLLKFLQLFILFIGITLISFFIIHLAPGNVVDIQQNMSIKMTPEARAKLEKLYGLDRPVWQQYGDWFARMTRLDFGNSFMDNEPVLQKIKKALPITLGLNLLSLFLIFTIGVWLGVYGATHAGKIQDKIITFFSFAGFSLPSFWMALLLVSFFGVGLRWLPVSGLHSIFYENLKPAEKLLDTAKHLILPVFVGSFGGIAGVSRYARSSMLDVLKQNYIRTAWAKGLSRNRVLYHHALRNALLPIVTLVTLSIPGLIGGSVIAESIFSIPGMGRLFYNSIFTRDYPVIMGILVFGAILTLISNALADFVYRVVDPRIKKT